MDLKGLELIDKAEVEEERHERFRATAPSLADNMTSFRQFIMAAIAVQTHFDLPTDGTPYTWDELREIARGRADTSLSSSCPK